MKRFLQSLFGLILLSLSVGPAFAVDRVLIPLRTDNALAVGSTVMLEWELAPYRAVNLSLGGSEVPFAENIPNKGWYRWTIAQDIEADRKNVRILVTPVSGAKPVASKAFTLKALPAKERYRGRIQHYDADLSDRPQVTYPVEGETIGPGMPLDVRWDDPDNLLLDRIQVHLRAHHRPAPLKVWGQGNSGQFTLPESERARFEKDCGSEPGCYFVVRSTTHKERRITSGHFVFGEAAETDVYLVSLTTESPSQGAEFEITWTDQGEVAHPVRVDLLKGDAYYLTFAESIGSTPGEDNTYSYLVPYTVAAGEDYRVEINAVGKPHHKGASDAFAIAGTEDKALSINAPKDPWVLAKRRTDGRITWKKPVKIKQVHVDLYKGDRRIRTVVDESKKRQLRWPVTRFLPTGEDYTLRIQDLADEATYAFSEAFCIRQSAENCDGTPKASAAKVIADTGSVSIVEVSPGASDDSSGDEDIEAGKLAWECQLRNLPSTCMAVHIEAVDSVCDDPTLSYFDRKILLEYFKGEGLSESGLEQHKAYGLDSLKEIAELAEQPRCKSYMEPRLGHAHALAKGCGEGTIELAGVCVPDHHCPGYDALDDERSFFPGTTKSPRGEARVCDKYLLQGNEDDEILAGLLEHINEILRFEPHNEEFYRTIWELRGFDTVSSATPGRSAIKGFIAEFTSTLRPFEMPRVETFWSFENGGKQRCFTSVGQEHLQNQYDTFKAYCGEESGAALERPSWCGGRMQGRFGPGAVGPGNYPLCNHWRTLDTPIKDRETIVKRTKKLLASRFLEVLEANRFGCQYALDYEGRSPLTSCSQKQPYWNNVLSYMGMGRRDVVTGELIDVAYDERAPSDWGFWWPGQALITDPEVIEDLRKRDPIKAAHAEFIRLMAAYHEASGARRTQIDFLAEAEEDGVERNAREAFYLSKMEELDVRLQFDPKYGLGDFSDNRAREGEFVWIEPWGRNGIHSTDRKIEPIAQLYSLIPIAMSSEVTCGTGTELKDGLCVVGAGACPAWRIASPDGCQLCPDGHSPNKSRTVCEDKECERNHFWDAVSQSCVNDRDKRQDRWVQMNLVGGFPDPNMEEVQNKQFTLLQGQLKAYAEQEDRSRDYVNVVGRNTGYLPHPDWGTDTSGVPEAPAGGYSELIEDQCDTTRAYSASGQYRHCRAVARTSYRQSVIEKQISYDSDLSAESYWDVEPEWTETINYDFAFDGGRTGPPLDNSEMLRGLLQRGLSSAEKGSAVFALNFNGHGIGVRSAEVDIREMREIIGDEMQGAPLDLVTFDSCRMGSYEALLMLEGRAKWVIAHTTWVPLNGWNPDGIGLAILGEDKKIQKGNLVAAGKGMRVSEMIDHIMDEISTQGEGEVLDEVGVNVSGSHSSVRYDSVVAYQMDRFANFREAFNDVLRDLTAKLEETPNDTLTKLLEIRMIDNNEVQDEFRVNKETVGGHRRRDFYHVDDFLKEIRKAFDADDELMAASTRATRALKRLTRKKPDNEQARMLFGWCSVSNGHVPRAEDCIAPVFNPGSVYSEKPLKALYDFNKSMAHARKSTGILQMYNPKNQMFY